MAKTDGIRVFYPPEILTVGSTQTLLQQVTDCLDSGIPTIVVDLRDVICIDSSGLGVLLSLYTKVRSYSGEICLCSPNQQARYLLALTDMGRIFEIFENQAEFYAVKFGDRSSVGCSADRQSSEVDRSDRLDRSN